MASLVNHSVNNLINGVSQQATSVRLDNQFEEQINCFSDVTKGLTIRNGLELKNIVDADISNRHKVEFNVDGEKYLVGIDFDDVTQLLHIPLTADVTALAASIVGADYFKNISSSDLRVVEDKDRVYILNKKKTVGTSTLKKTFFDINIVNDRTFLSDTNWSVGSYTLTIDAQADPETSATVSSGTVNIVVDSTMTTKDIADLINAEAALILETGACYIVGDIGSYRLHFDSIPDSYIAPTISIAETVAITNQLTVFTEETKYVPSGAEWSVVRVNNDPYSYYWAGPRIAYTRNLTYKQNATYTYRRGRWRTSYSSNGTTISKYEIIRIRTDVFDDDYTPSITPADDLTGAEYTADKFADKGMIWVTGVASNQEYDVTIKYTDAAGTPQPDLVLTSINVGITVSNIKLNWVAGQIQSQVNGAANFTAVQYDNAVYFYSTTPQAYLITSIEATNNFDNTSLNAVANATIDNGAAIQDISNLPPLFIEGFKVRVGDEDVEGSNYYLKYDAEFQGWKECGLDESRVLDKNTMPFVIDKNEIRQNSTITLKPIDWTPSRAGDDDSNPYPSFVDKTINDIFFYGSRLGFATDDTIVMSKVNEPESFFRTTCSRTVENERVDIKLDSSKIGYETIKHISTSDGKLLVNTGSTQSVLLVNTAFDLSSARLSEVSTYTLGDNRPLPVNDGIYFALSVNNFTNIYNYNTKDGAYLAENITKHIPTYIEGNAKNMAYAADFVALSVEENPRVLYVQNRFTQDRQVLQNAWHKWELPYDLEYFYFDDNTLYVLMSAQDTLAATKTLVTEYDLTPQVVTEADENGYIGWVPYLDCWTKDKTLAENFSEFIGINDRYGNTFTTVTEAYDSTLNTQIDEGAVDGPYFDLSSPAYYWNVTGNTINIVWNDGTTIASGNGQNLTELDFGGFRYYRGDLQDGSGNYEVSRTALTTTQFYEDEIVYGIPFTVHIEFSKVIPRQESQSGFIVMNYAKLMLRRMRLLMNKSGVFTVNIDFEDRNDYTVSYTGKPLGSNTLGRSNVSDINFNFPINGKSDKVTITIKSNSSTPFNLLSAEWQGQLIMRGRNI